MIDHIRLIAFIGLYGVWVFILWGHMLHMFQQNRYESFRLIKWMASAWMSFLPMVLTSGIAVSLAFWISHNLDVRTANIAIIWFYVVVLIIYTMVQSRKTFIKPLVYTWRVKRQMVVLTLLNLVIIFALFYFLPSYWMYLLAISWPLQWVLLFITAIITAPIEAFVRSRFKAKAKDLLETMHPTVIGITGSFGKTSAKTILQDVLSTKFISLMTPGSFNTPMGITRTIREQLKPYHEIFICEMGADHVGDIQELMDFVHPKYGLVTSIGEQHLNTFHSLDNIIKEKMKEIEMLPADGVGFLNLDNEYIRGYTIKNTVKTISFAIDYPADYQAINITYSPEGAKFEIVHDGLAYPFETRLLGRNNVSNVLAAVAISRELGVEWNDVIRAVKQVNPVEHRLQKRIINGFTFIDNAFNSNPVGAATSLDVMSQMPGRRVIITPGLIDLGSKQYQYNHDFGLAMKDKVDDVLLVGKQQTAPIHDGLKESGFDMDHVLVVDTVKEAFAYVYRHFTSNDTILLENDLPDAFSR